MDIIGVASVRSWNAHRSQLFRRLPPSCSKAYAYPSDGQ
jgi:hypothetical protein